MPILETVCPNEKCDKFDQPQEHIVTFSAQLPKICADCGGEVEQVEFYPTSFKLVGKWFEQGY